MRSAIGIFGGGDFFINSHQSHGSKATDDKSDQAENQHVKLSYNFV